MNLGNIRNMWLLVCLIILSQSPSVNGQWTGRVASEDGPPVVGAKVCSATWFCVEPTSKVFTGSTRHPTPVARFYISAQKDLCRPPGGFQKRPARRDSGEGSAPAWRIPKCGAKGKGQWIGDGLVVLVPSGVAVTQGSDVDYWIKQVRFSGTERLQVGGGPNWSTGLPSLESLKLSVETSERELMPGKVDKQTEATSIEGVDVRGTYSDGTKWRFTGDAFLTFSYERVSPEAAASLTELSIRCVVAGRTAPSPSFQRSGLARRSGRPRAENTTGSSVQQLIWPPAELGVVRRRRGSSSLGLQSRKAAAKIGRVEFNSVGARWSQSVRVFRIATAG